MSTADPLHARRVSFRFPEGGFYPHYVGGDLVMSHVVACLSAIFPEGEDFFIRSVRHFIEDVDDPALKRQVKGFIGQEVTHSREHHALNDRLQQMGYPTRFIDRTLARAFRWEERVLSPLTCLAATAALEHYTAVFAETILSDADARALLGASEVRSMLLWHAYEESEHRSVAFDVYRAIGGSERRRIWVKRVITYTFLGTIIAATAMSLARDRATYHPLRLARSLAALRQSPFLKRSVRERIRQYNNIGFHPDDVDNTALLQHWSTQLFGESGQLADHLR